MDWISFIDNAEFVFSVDFIIDSCYVAQSTTTCKIVQMFSHILRYYMDHVDWEAEESENSH